MGYDLKQIDDAVMSTQSLNKDDQVEQNTLYTKMFESVKSYDVDQLKSLARHSDSPKLKSHLSLQFLKEACCPVHLDDDRALWQLWYNPVPKLERAKYKKKEMSLKGKKKSKKKSKNVN